MKIGGQGIFSCPFHCIQSGEYFIVSDHNEHCLSVFNKEGRFQYKVGKHGGGDGEFSFSGYLSLTQSNHLLVCDWGNHRVQVFELNGKFIGKFGTKGSKLGEFNNPVSVANLSNGKIVVSDKENNRIQIFDYIT